MAAHAGAGDFHCSLWLANMIQPCWFIRKSPTEDMAAHAGAGDFHCSLRPANMVQPCWFIDREYASCRD